MDLLEPDEATYEKLTFLGKTRVVLNPLSEMIGDLEIMCLYDEAEAVRGAVQAIAQTQTKISEEVSKYGEGRNVEGVHGEDA